MQRTLFISAFNTEIFKSSDKKSLTNFLTNNWKNWPLLLNLQIYSLAAPLATFPTLVVVRSGVATELEMTSTPMDLMVSFFFCFYDWLNLSEFCEFVNLQF